MKHKSEVLKCFQDFCSFIGNQYDAQVKVLRTDNGTEYVNNEFGNFLSAHGMLHQTPCPDTPPQNGVAERKKPSYLGGCSFTYVYYECAEVFVEGGRNDSSILD
jgi:hypothetical protein